MRKDRKETKSADLAAVFSGCNQYVFDRIKSYCYQRGTIDMATIERIAPTVKRDYFI